MTPDPLAQLKATEGEKNRDWISLKFVLGQLDPKVQDAVRAAAVPHWFDFEVLSTIVGPTSRLTKKTFKALTSLSFVELFPGHGYNIHESTRSLILKHLSTHEHELLKEYSREAAKYFHSKRSLGDSWLIEGIYHSTVGGNASYFDLMKYGLTFQSDFKHGETETLCRTILECRQFIKLSKQILAGCFYLLGTSYSHFGKTRRAKEAIRSALNLKVKDPFFNAICWRALADIEYTLNKRALAKRHYSKALEFHDKAGDDSFVAGCLLAIAQILWLEDKPQKAISYTNRALKRYERVKAPSGVAGCYRFLGTVALYGRKIKLAGYRYRTALRYSKIGRDVTGIVRSLVGLAKVEIERGNVASARKLITPALRKANKIKNTGLYAETRYVDALLEYASARYDRAEKKALEAAKLFEEIEDQYLESDVWDLLSNVYVSTNELEKALSSTVKARQLFQSSNNRSLAGYSNRISELKSALRLQKRLSR